MSKKDFQYDVALSFAEEDHEVVECVVKELKEKGISYYYYKESEVETWGEPLSHFLKDIYSKKARLCVIFFSKHYLVKRWTKFEMRTAKRRASKNVTTYILPLKLDDTPINDVLGDVAYIPVQQRSCESLADIIYNKLQQAKRPVSIARRLKHVFSQPKNIMALLLFLAGIILYPDQLLPVDVLAKKLYEKNTVHHCTICVDGSISYSRGRGTCSHHFGIARPVEDTLLHKKTMEQCLEEASEISWFSE